MTKNKLETLSIDELVEQFASICVAQDHAMLYEKQATVNKLYWEMKAVDFELRRRGQGARLALVRLYEHPIRNVRLNVAKSTLAVAPVAARQVIEEIARSGVMPEAADARGCLRSLDTGVFKPT
jgi:hypothetical protein